MTTHTNVCLEAQAAVVAWELAHPNYCRKCNGTGEVDASDPSVGMWGAEPCEHCVCGGKCPQCSNQHGEEWCTEQNDACEHCGFVVGGAGCPEWSPEDCDCGRAEDEAQAEAARLLWESQPVALDADFFRRAEDDYQASRDRGLRSSFRGRD